MAEEIIPEETPEVETPTPPEAEAPEMTAILMDIQGILANMQLAIDKIAPVTEEVPEVDGEGDAPPEPDTPAETPERTPEEIAEVDRQLQEN